MMCIHRGGHLRYETCSICTRKGNLEEVFSCAVHGQCSRRVFDQLQTRQNPPVAICSVCDDRQPRPALSIVYVYAHRYAVGDELRWSLRSLANIQGNVRPIVVGDPPKWYDGPRIQMGAKGLRYADTTAKFIAAATSPLVSDPFVVFMDDTIVWSPITIEDLSTPRYYRIGIEGRRKSGHSGIVRRTLKACGDRGFTQYDTATHWPYPFEKQKLLETIDIFNIGKQDLCVEVAYPNQWSQPAVPVRKDFLYWKQPSGPAGDHVKILNYGQLNPVFRLALADRFKDPSPWETDSIEVRPPPPRSVMLTPSACVHLGPVKRFVRNAGRGRSPVFACAVHGECVIAKTIGIATSCLRCKQFEPRGEPVHVEFVK